MLCQRGQDLEGGWPGPGGVESYKFYSGAKVCGGIKVVCKETLSWLVWL